MSDPRANPGPAQTDPAAKSPPAQPAPGPTGLGGVAAMLRDKGYIRLLILAALLGAPISAVAFGFMQLVNHLQHWFYDSLPEKFGFHGTPVWWPLPLLALSGVLVALFITRLPGRGGHSPADPFGAGMTEPKALPGVILAALGTLGLGVVLGPEAPLIALGGGLAVLTIRLANKDTPMMAQTVFAAAGSFAALGTILGSPIVAAVFMMEAIGLGGPLLSLVLLPGLLAAAIGSLVFIGLGQWTGLGSATLSIPSLPAFPRPTLADLGWALVLGLVIPFVAFAIRQTAFFVRARVEPKMVVLMPVLGLAIGALAIIFAEATGRPVTDVLFSGQSFTAPLIASASSWTVKALVLLVLCKGAAYALSLSSFRGGPIFPSLLLGAAGGIAASHLPGLALVPAIGICMGAMTAAMLRLPVSSVLLPTLLLAKDAVAVAPVIIGAVVVSYVVMNVLMPVPEAAAPVPAGAS
ncbi:MAG: chloride channel protein [Acidimicrobiales bacterium]